MREDMEKRMSAPKQLGQIKDDTLAKAVRKLMPLDPYDFRMTVTLSELRIAVFSSHVPVMRVNTTAPVTLAASRENQMSSFTVGCLQSSFLSQSDMVYALAKTLNCQF